MPRSRKIQAQINNLNELAKRQKVHDGTRQSPSVHPSPPLGPSQGLQSHVAQQVSSDAAVVDVHDKKMPEADNPVYDELRTVTWPTICVSRNFKQPFFSSQHSQKSYLLHIWTL